MYQFWFEPFVFAGIAIVPSRVPVAGSSRTSCGVAGPLQPELGQVGMQISWPSFDSAAVQPFVSGAPGVNAV